MRTRSFKRIGSNHKLQVVNSLFLPVVMKPSTWLWLSPATTRRWWRSKGKAPVRSSPSLRVSSSRATVSWIPSPSTTPVTWMAATITIRLRCAARWQPTPRPAAPWGRSPPNGSPRRTAVREPRGTSPSDTRSSVEKPHGIN